MCPCCYVFDSVATAFFEKRLVPIESNLASKLPLTCPVAAVPAAAPPALNVSLPARNGPLPFAVADPRPGDDSADALVFAVIRWVSDQLSAGLPVEKTAFSSVSLLPSLMKLPPSPFVGGAMLRTVSPGPPKPPPRLAPQKRLPASLSVALSDVRLIVLKKCLSSFAVSVPVRTRFATPPPCRCSRRAAPPSARRSP